MEDRRPLISLLAILACIVVIALPVSGYDNLAAHPAINKYAIEYFTQMIMPTDPYLSTARLDGVSSYGLDWNLSDGRRDLPSHGLISKPKTKTLALWIIDGGFSQDEPEWWMALRHFYDPTNPDEPWLTDSTFWRNLARAYAGEQMTDPKTDAVSWAFDASKGNEYSYPKAREYFTKALASDDRNNQYYGQAWRAVGETMHLVADMTIPDHVRNDGHALQLWGIILIDISPYEETTDLKIINDIAPYPGLYPPANLNYQASPRQVMIDVAGFTNRNFISQDSNSEYSQPDLSQAAAENGYIMGNFEGTQYRVAKKVSFLSEILYDSQSTNMKYINFNGNNPKLDYFVLADQQKILVPTAVRANAAVLDRFLPRFKVNGEIKTDQVMIDRQAVTQYYLDGEIILTGNKEEWPQKLTIRNGASIVNSQTGERVTIPVDMTTGDNLNTFRYMFIPAEVGAKAGDKIYLEYDLGGYVVRSADIVVPEEYPTPTPTTVETMTPVETITAARAGTCPSNIQYVIEYYDIDYACGRTLLTYVNLDDGNMKDSQRQALIDCGCCQRNFDDFVIFSGGYGNEEYWDAFSQLCR